MEIVIAIIVLLIIVILCISWYRANKDYSYTYKGALLIDPDNIKAIEKAKFKNKLIREAIVHLAAQAEVLDSATASFTKWWGGKESDTDAKYRPFVTFGVQRYDYVEEIPENDKVVSLPLGATKEDIKAAIAEFDTIKQIGIDFPPEKKG